MRARLIVGALVAGTVALGGCGADQAGVVTCQEDEAAVVAPSSQEGLDWVCVTLDDWADPGSIARLDAILADRSVER